ncbi:MAG: hypothetical protein ACRES5_11510, partial [Pseudomonas sp.]
WEKDFSQGKVEVPLEGWNKPVEVTTTSELVTEMRSRPIYPLNPKPPHAAEEEKLTYLSHEDFFYFIRLQNLSNQYQEVTVRIFLAPEIWVNEDSSTNRDNTVWIEMDRFMHELDAGERTVVFRPAKVSAVIRKPAFGHADLENPKKSRDFTDPWCDCGWPYNLLLPRGTKEGMDFRLLVMLSSGSDLAMTDTGQENTSIGYCGLKNMKYPDTQLMGYPFDRPLTDSVDSLCNKNDNWASKTIKIRCKNPELDTHYPKASRQAASDTTSARTPEPQVKAEPIIIKRGYTFKEKVKISSGSKKANLVFQPDGNLVIYDENNKARWASNTNRRGKRCVFQDDGNLVVYGAGKNNPLWASQTADNQRSGKGGRE